MMVPLDLLPMALCGLATIVAVAVILVTSDLLRRLVLWAIASFEQMRRTPPAPTERRSRTPVPRAGRAVEDARPRAGASNGVEETVSRSETLPG
jgi:hypothetical protein